MAISRRGVLTGHPDLFPSLPASQVDVDEADEMLADLGAAIVELRIAGLDETHTGLFSELRRAFTGMREQLVELRYNLAKVEEERDDYRSQNEYLIDEEISDLKAALAEAQDERKAAEEEYTSIKNRWEEDADKWEQEKASLKRLVEHQHETIETLTEALILERQWVEEMKDALPKAYGLAQILEL